MEWIDTLKFGYMFYSKQKMTFRLFSYDIIYTQTQACILTQTFWLALIFALISTISFTNKLCQQFIKTYTAIVKLPKQNQGAKSQE